MNDVKPDTTAVLHGLKDFQLRTVDYVFQRLYTDVDSNSRFLIADEVGLGKTQCARGVIAKAVTHLWDTTERIDIIYICSNAEIARQNIDRLNITGQPDFTLASRITLLPLHIRDMSSRRINFVSFTPGTSFDQHAGMGTAYERALIYLLIQEAWEFGGSAASFNVLCGNSQVERFKWTVNQFDKTRIDPFIAKQFVESLSHRSDLHDEFEELCAVYCRLDSRIDNANRVKRSNFINNLRSELASQCLLALEPDLIILDEFQRFKDLLVNDDEASRLARKLFDYQNARVLLLSATPYKMLSLHHEAEENHYEDFLKTVSFLTNEAGTSTFAALIRDYRQALFNLGESADLKALVCAKEALECALHKIMTRTERLAITDDRDGMLLEKLDLNLRLESKDVTAFVGLQQVASCLEQRGMIEYWKSAPYLLNFMDGYELKRVLHQRMNDPESRRLLASSLRRFPEMVLSHDRILDYKSVDERHPRLRSLLDDTVRAGAWRLLWIPPSLPYYQMRGPFADPLLSDFTKRLIFSSWQVAPKAIACMTSYAAEREIMRGYEPHARNTPEARKSTGRFFVSVFLMSD